MTNNTLIRIGCVVLFFFLSGCIPKSIVDEVSLMHYVGFDRENSMLKGVVVYPNYAQKNNSSLITANARNPSSLKMELGHKSQYNVEMGQVRVIVFGDELSRYGLSQMLDAICKDPKFGIARIAISSGSSKDVLEKTLNESPLYLIDLLDESMESEGIPITDLHTMYDQFFGSGIDMYFPNLNLDSDGKIIVDGMAIFKKNKLQYKISDKEALLLKLLTDKNKRGTYDFNLSKNDHNTNIGVETLYGKHKTNIINENHEEKAKINLVLNIELEGLPDWVVLKKENDYTSLKYSLQKSISSEAESLLRTFQANEVDPVGLGRIHRTKHKNWSENDFYENIYPKMTFEVNTKVIIRQAGVGK
ncbi:Ger(x)C family spore germination protein [Metabacillus idriensis]|uniref:Ger(x)C family spore germination protein n=1 Tax=Metabacillus idriensis TaxID=324768 RepID=UPI003D281329